MSELNQLLLDFDIKTNFNEHDYYVSASNYFAFNLIDKWPKWEKRILNISGEKFSGKTHLANIFKSKTSALFLNENQMNDEIFKKIKLHESIIIDGFKNIIDEKLTYSILNLIDQDSKYLLINSVTPLSEINFDLMALGFVVLRLYIVNCSIGKLRYLFIGLRSSRGSSVEVEQYCCH